MHEIRVLDTSALEHVATVVPTTALTAAWARIPTEAHPVLEVLLGLPNTVPEVLDGSTAHEVGLLLAAARAGAITLYVRRTPPFRDSPGSGHARETP